jgi:pSer/pThr/pTyr-binding forkhead associated (FHA) protein
MKLSLLVLTSGKQAGKVIEIKLPQFVVGRDPQCHLRPASPLISNRHCMFIQRDGKAFIRDFDSTNGTFVNEEPVKGERELHHDDQIKIGPIGFTVRIQPDVKPTMTPAPATRAAGVKTPLAPTKPVASTPLPATTGTSGAKKGEDDIAAMLLSLDGDDSPAGEGPGPAVPDGSTVLDIQLPPEGAPVPAKDEKKGKQPSGDTRSAAASILEKMMKRPRA